MEEEDEEEDDESMDMKADRFGSSRLTRSQHNAGNLRRKDIVSLCDIVNAAVVGGDEGDNASCFIPLIIAAIMELATDLYNACAFRKCA